MTPRLKTPHQLSTVGWTALSFAVSFALVGALADQASAWTKTDLSDWWTLCFITVGTCGGVILSLRVDQNPYLLMLVGAAGFGGAYRLVLFAFDLFSLGLLPYYLSSVLVFALVGGIGSSILGWTIGARRCGETFLLVGLLSFGLGRSADLAIRNSFLHIAGYVGPAASALSVSTGQRVGICALFCLGIIAGTGFGYISSLEGRREQWHDATNSPIS